MSAAGPPGWVRRFLAPGDLDAVARAVGGAETGTSGEIRVHLDARCPGDPMARAVALFERLGMTRTARRHGVLIYVAIQDRKLAVIGDAGVSSRVPAEYWDGLRDTLVAHFRERRPRDGLVAAVREVGETLRRHFPRGRDDENELTDDVSLA
ncbi:MAG: TPM domain-containing protein [Candidatus Rokuibacteriota bacterium]